MSFTDRELGELSQSLNNIEGDVAYLRNKFDKLEDKFAAKWVERLAVGMVSFILLAVLYAVVQNVIPDKSVKAQAQHAITR